MVSLSRKIKSVLLIDIPTYKVSLPEVHRALMEKRWRLQSILWERRVGRRLIRPALCYSRGLLTIAACLERSGFQTVYLNYSDPSDRVEIHRVVKEVDAVCITVLTPTFHIVVRLCNEIKQVNPNAVIIIGGPHISARPTDSLRSCPMADFAMIGESEHRLPALLGLIDTPDEIAGTVYRDGSAVQISPGPIKPVFVSDLPIPAYHLLRRPLTHYAHNIRMSRGCPYKCNFCVERLSWNSELGSERRIEQVFEEVEFLSHHLQPGTLIHFSDAVLNISWNRLNELIRRIKGADIHLLYSFDTRVDLINETQARALYEGSFVYFRMGFESARDDVLRTAEKSTDHQRQLEACRIIRNASDRIAILAYMVTGLPGSTRETIALDAIYLRQMVQDEQVDIIGNKIFVPYPGTPYFDNASGFNITIKTRDWSKYDRNSYPVYELADLSSDEIYFGFLQQEAFLTQAYMDMVTQHGFTFEAIDIMELDYSYQNYARVDDLH
jgi:radical SAM superfamily enzyme YgiQ (UPF0313 family)